MSSPDYIALELTDHECILMITLLSRVLLPLRCYIDRLSQSLAIIKVRLRATTQPSNQQAVAKIF